MSYLDKTYDFIIVGGGIAGCSVAMHLQDHTNNFAIIDKLSNVGMGASKAAGAFLSPLLGKPNNLKSIVDEALQYSVDLYKTNMTDLIDNCGTIRIPKNNIDEKKFNAYVPYLKYKFTKQNDGYLFDIGSVVKAQEICEALCYDTNKILNYNIERIEFKDNIWYINDQIKTKNIILANGATKFLIDEPYLNIRSVWGQRIIVQTTTTVQHNYHKNCSISKSTQYNDQNIVSIGATHHRNITNHGISSDDTQELLSKAKEIMDLQNIKVVDQIAGARASSIDYLPLVGKIINYKKTLELFPHLAKGTNVKEDRFITYPNMYCLNGLGGRGFVLAPYLAKQLTNMIFNNQELNPIIKTNRLFKSFARKH